MAYGGASSSRQYSSGISSVTPSSPAGLVLAGPASSMRPSGRAVSAPCRRCSRHGHGAKSDHEKYGPHPRHSHAVVTRSASAVVALAVPPSRYVMRQRTRSRSGERPSPRRTPASRPAFGTAVSRRCEARFLGDRRAGTPVAAETVAQLSKRDLVASPAARTDSRGVCSAR